MNKETINSKAVVVRVARILADEIMITRPDFAKVIADNSRFGYVEVARRDMRMFRSWLESFTGVTAYGPAAATAEGRLTKLIEDDFVAGMANRRAKGLGS